MNSFYFLTPLFFLRRVATAKNFGEMRMANRKQEELVIIVKTYDLMKWCCDHTSKFPRNYRFVLGERIERNLFEILESEAPVAAQSQLPWHRARGGCKAAGKADV